MKIKHIHVENFGTLNNIDLNLKNNANFLLKDNGWGKTTLAVFIKVMLYGFSNESKNDAELNERLRYKPWQGGVYGGSIIFSVGTKEYRLSKTFGNKKNEDSFALYDAKTNLVTNDYFYEPGLEIFGIDKEAFLKLVYISGNSSDLSVNSGMQAKLGGISVIDEDIHNYDRVKERIKKEKDYLNPNRKTGEIQKRYRELSMLQASLSRKSLEEERMFAIKEEIADLEYKREKILEKLGRFNALKASSEKEELLEKSTISEGEFLEDVSDNDEIKGRSKWIQVKDSIFRLPHLDEIEPMEFLLTLRDEILDLLEEKVRDKKEFIKDIVVLFIIVFVGFLLSHIIWGDGIFKFGSVIFMFISSVLLTIILYIILRFTVFKKIDPNKYGKKNREDASSGTKKEDNPPVEEMKKKQTEENKEIEEKKQEESKHLETELLEEEKRILERLLTLRQEKIELSEITNGNLLREKEFYEKKKEYLALKQRYELLTSTEYYLEKAKISYIGKYMKPLKLAFDKYFLMFTKEKDDRGIVATTKKETIIGNSLVMDANFDIHIDTNGVLHSTNVLSDGYRDVAGLCKRFALLDVMYKKEHPLIILDDPFVNFDDKKMNKAMQFLMELSKQGQVLYFTCNQSRFPRV